MFSPLSSSRNKRSSWPFLRLVTTVANCLIFSVLLHFSALDFTSALVQSPPLITKQPSTDELLFQVKKRRDENDRPFSIECEAEGEPPPQYKWIKNGKDFNWQDYNQRISQQQGKGTLVVTSPQTEDIGQYQCFAYNKWGTATSNSVFLRKSELNSFKEEDPAQILAEEGKPWKLGCSPPDGWPKPHVYWMLQSNTGALQSINSSRITVDPEGTLWFSNVTRSDKSSEFLYVCAAYSSFRNEYKLGNRVYLNVVATNNASTLNKHRPQIQYASKRNTVAIRGSTVRLWCIFGGTPLPEIKWSKKGGMLPFHNLEYENYGKTLTIKDVDFSHEGSYTCDGSNGVASPVSYSITLSVYAAPYFTYKPESKNVTEGETAEFRCEAGGKPSPEIQWTQNGLPLDHAEYNLYYLRREILGENRIVIKNVTKQDIGNYGCNATNSFGYVYKDVYVNVVELPAEILEIPKDVVTTDGKSVTLTCSVFGVPRPIVRWFKIQKDNSNGRPGGRKPPRRFRKFKYSCSDTLQGLSPPSKNFQASPPLKNQEELTGRRYKILDNGYLEIRDVRFSDAGEYRCNVENKFGNDSAGGTLVVKEHTKIVDKPEDSEVAEGSTATFRCSAVKDPTLTLWIDWLNDHEIIDFDSKPRYIKLQDNSLTIDKTTKLDSGLYTCVARTDYDNATASATLVVYVVEDVPNMPELLSVECGRRTATLKWKPMEDNRSSILYYSIQYNTGFTPDIWEELASRDIIPAAETSYTVSMSPYANITFRVIASNKIGPSTPSHPSSACTTTPDVPFKNPDNVKGHGTSPSNLVISWTSMAEIDHNAANFKYVVEWKPDDNSSGWQIENINDWRTSQLVIENQPTYRPYRIRVKAVNEIGETHEPTEDVIGYSGMAEPTESPANFTLIQKIDDRTAAFSWDPVNPENIRGKFEGYKIQMWTDNEGDGDRKEILIKNDVTEAVVDKLTPFSKNYVVVLAYNTDYNGPNSRIIEVKTEEATPGPVQSFDGYPLGASALYLVWGKPEQPNGILTGYRLYYQKVTGTEVGALMVRVPPIMDPETTDAKLAGLAAATKYRIRLRATTSKGAGEVFYIERSTEQEGQTTPLNKPKFTLAQITTDSSSKRATILVKWLPNTEGSGRAGSHFFVQYKRFGDTRFENTEPESYNLYTTVRGLEPGTTYIFRVVSVDGNEQEISNAKEIYITPSAKNILDGPVVQAKPGSRTTGW